MVESKKDITDWRELEPLMVGGSLTPEWISSRRSVLEWLVEPYVTTKKTGQIITFRGKRRYLSVDPRQLEQSQMPSFSTRSRPLYAVIALQFLYRMEAAKIKGDLDTLVKMAIGFAHADTEESNRYLFGTDTCDAITHRLESKKKRRDTRLGKTALKDVPDIILEASYAQHKGARKRNWLQCVTNDVIKHTGEPVASKTVGTELRKRRIKK